MTKQHKKHLNKLELEATISMKLKELERLDIIQAVCRKELPVWRAAEKLDVSRRQTHRLVNRFLKHGPAGLIVKSHDFIKWF